VKISDLKAGEAVRGFRDWGCVPSNATRTVRQDSGGLFVVCNQGKHYLDGQEDESGQLVGMKMAQRRHLVEAH
jgi:hypothetical protein